MKVFSCTYDANCGFFSRVVVAPSEAEARSMLDDPEYQGVENWKLEEVDTTFPHVVEQGGYKE